MVERLDLASAKSYCTVLTLADRFAIVSWHPLAVRWRLNLFLSVVEDLGRWGTLTGLPTKVAAIAGYDFRIRDGSGPGMSVPGRGPGGRPGAR